MEEILQVILQQIIEFKFDALLDTVLHTSVVDYPKEGMILSDQVYLYREIWKEHIKALYIKYLPQHQFEFDWKLELNPYTIMLCRMAPLKSNKTYFNHFKKMTKYPAAKVLPYMNEQLEALGLGAEYQAALPANIWPADPLDRASLLFRLMCFPPLEIICHFYHNVHDHYTEGLKKLHGTLGNAYEKEKWPSFTSSEPLHYSVYHINHSLLKKYPVETLVLHRELERFRDRLVNVLDRAELHKDDFSDTILSPHDGSIHTVTVPVEALVYKFLLEDSGLAKQIGLIYIDEVEDAYLRRLTGGMSSFLSNLNKVEQPDVLILVEGPSEEVAIPILGFRKRFTLNQYKIFVHNSESKQKLAADFLSTRKKYPNRKIICLLDSDAEKEKKDIERLMKDQHHKYHLVFIEKGAWEDLFLLSESVRVLNDLFPEGEALTVEDFDPAKDFNSNIKKIMFQKKRAEFDKVKFSERMAITTNVDQLPAQINEIFDIAKKFTDKGKALFVK